MKHRTAWEALHRWNRHGDRAHVTLPPLPFFHDDFRAVAGIRRWSPAIREARQ